MNAVKSDNQALIRQSNIELLRIIAMVIIVAHHFAVHGGFDFPIETVAPNRLWIQFLALGGKIGVNIFVLISGYFLIDAKSLKKVKVLKLWLQIFTYSALYYVIFVLAGLKSFHIRDLIVNFFPITFSRWWFASSYFVLYLLSPFINRFLASLDKKLFLRLLIIFAVIWCIISMVTDQIFRGHELLWFIYLYSLGGYIRHFDPVQKLQGKTYILWSVVFVFFTWLSAVILDFIGTEIPIFGQHATFFYEMQSLPVIVISVGLFIGFSKIDIGCRRIINIISSTTFGVYLIHDNKYIRSFIWDRVFNNAAYADSDLLILYSLYVISSVYICCTLIELLRIRLFENRYMGLVNRVASKIDPFKICPRIK